MAGSSPHVVTGSPDVFAGLTAPDEELFPFLAWLREHDPVHRTSAGFYLVSRYADISRAYRGTGTDFRTPSREELPTYYPHVVKHRCLQLACDTLLMKNPPEHTRLRRLVARDFTPRRVEELRERIEQITGRLLDAITEPLRDGEIVDLDATVSKELPRFVFAALFGVPDADSPWLSSLIDEVIGGLSPAATEEQLIAADEAIVRVEAYFAELCAQRRRAPRQDLISALVSLHSDGPDRLNEEELMCMLRSLWLPTFDTSSNTLNHGFLAILDHPDQRGWLRGDHAQAVMFTEEVLRHRPTVMLTVAARIATRDIEMSGVTLPEGSDVRTLPVSGNRDSAAFGDADRFDPSRFDRTAQALTRRHSMPLAFSDGIHYCLGAHLARTQTAVVLQRLHCRFPNLVLATEPTRKTTLIMRKVLRVPVRLDAAAGSLARSRQ